MHLYHSIIHPEIVSVEPQEVVYTQKRAKVSKIRILNLEISPFYLEDDIRCC